MNYHRNCSASGMFVFNSIYLVLWNCGETIVMVLCSDSTTATIQSSLPLFRPVGCHPLCGGAGNLFCTLNELPPVVFFILLICICYFHCSCDRHLGLYYVSVFDPIVL